MDKDIKVALNAIKEKFGSGSIAIASEAIETIRIRKSTTDILALDLLLEGGLPQSSLVEFWGGMSSLKTTSALLCAKKYTQNKQFVALIDLENSFDPERANILGIDMDYILLSKPTTLEEAVDICETLTLSRKIPLIIFDSIASGITSKEQKKAAGEMTMASKAQILTPAIGKLLSALQPEDLTDPSSRNETTIILINQMRNSIGVMYGCNHATNIVIFKDGRNIPIKTVVDKKIRGEVLSFNENSKVFEYKEIIDWHNNGQVFDNKDFVYLEMSAIETKHGLWSAILTPDHKVLTKYGWKEVAKLKVGDEILSKYKSIMNGTVEEFINGISIGDSHLYQNGSNAALVLQDSNNLEYVNWKMDKLKSFISFKKITYKKRDKFRSEFTREFQKHKILLKNRNPIYILNKLTNLSLAIWIMDDGHLDLKNNHCRYNLSMGRLKNDKKSLKIISQYFKTLKLKFNLDRRGTYHFDKLSSNIIAQKIYRYVPPCMQYKLPPIFRNQYQDFNLSAKIIEKEDFSIIKKIRYASKKQMRNKGKYDISIKDNKNYAIGGNGNGIIIHNSPESMQGGFAVQHGCMAIIKFYAGKWIENKGNTIGRIYKITSIKSKVSTPHKTATFNFYFNPPKVDNADTLITLGVQLGVIKQGGAFYSYDKFEKIKGKVAFINKLKESKDLLIKLKSELFIVSVHMEKEILEESTELEESEDTKDTNEEE